MYVYIYMYMYINILYILCLMYIGSPVTWNQNLRCYSGSLRLILNIPTVEFQ